MKAQSITLPEFQKFLNEIEVMEFSSDRQRADVCRFLESGLRYNYSSLSESALAAWGSALRKYLFSQKAESDLSNFIYNTFSFSEPQKMMLIKALFERLYVFPDTCLTPAVLERLHNFVCLKNLCGLTNKNAWMYAVLCLLLYFPNAEIPTAKFGPEDSSVLKAALDCRIRQFCELNPAFQKDSDKYIDKISKLFE